MQGITRQADYDPFQHAQTHSSHRDLGVDPSLDSL
jgi:hypothetical protein